MLLVLTIGPNGLEHHASVTFSHYRSEKHRWIVIILLKSFLSLHPSGD